MAHLVFTDGYFAWNAATYSTHVREIHLRSNRSFVSDAHVMGATAEKYLPVLEDYDLEIVFSQDFAASQIDKIIGVDALAKTARAFEIRPTSGAVSATNPKYTGTGFIETYEPVNGAFGEVLGTRITIKPSVGGLTRAEA